MAFGVGREEVMRRMSKSAVRVAREALVAGRAALPEYASPYSRKDYTQPQLFALLVLRQFLRVDYRGVMALVAEWSELRRTLGLAKVPHYSTLAHASRRILADAEAGGLSLASRLPWSGVPEPRPDRHRTGRGRGRDRARNPSRQRPLRPAPGQGQGTPPAGLAEADRRAPYRLAPPARRRAGPRPEPGITGLHPGHAPSCGTGRDRHRPR